MPVNDNRNAAGMLEARVQKAIKNRYGDVLQTKVIERMNRELEVIKEQGTAERFLILSDALCATGAEPDEFFLRGSTGSLIVAYLLGLSSADPLDEQLPLYAEVCLGVDGERKPEMELNVDSGLLKKLADYFDAKYGREMTETKNHPDESLSMVKVYVGRTLKNDPKFFINLINGDWAENVDSFRDNEIYASMNTNDPVSRVKCYGLIQGTDTWNDNAKELLQSGIAQLEEIIAFREDVYEMMLKHGIESREAFKIMDYVGKGKAKKSGFTDGMIRTMEGAGIPEWYIGSCEKIAYLFPRSHAINMLKWCGML
jgi:DNA polymerase III alpha subunit (gram-positive type)